MTTQTLLHIDLAQGTVVTRSIEMPQRFVSSVTQCTGLNPADLADQNLWIGLNVQIQLSPGVWIPAGTYEWTGGCADIPRVQWSGLCRRMRVVLDLSRPVSVGVQASY